MDYCQVHEHFMVNAESRAKQKRINLATVEKFLLQMRMR